MAGEEYDEKTCITAGELRGLGIRLPEDIPDVAWVPRIALVFKPGKGRVEGDKLLVDVGVEVLAPFRWVSVDLVIGEKS